MIAKELWEARWKLLIGLLLFVIVVGNLIPYEVILRDALSSPPTVGPDGSPLPEEFIIPMNAVEYALSEMWLSYGVSGGWVMLMLAAFLGFSLVSGEVSRNSIFLLIAKPVSRTRLLLTKYVVAAGILLAVAILGVLGLVASAGLKDYPLDILSITGLILSTALLWLGSMSALGLAILVSIIFRDVIASAVATPLAFALVFFFPGAIVSYFVEVYGGPRSPEAAGQMFEKLTLPFYWASEDLFMGESLAATSFLVCAIATAVPLLVALWLFNRKAY